MTLGDAVNELGVTHMLEGSVRKAGGRVRITAQLVDGVTEGHLWAKRWDRDLEDIFALQDEISDAIVSALKVKLLPAEKQAIERRGTANPEAYNAFLMARQYYVGTSQKRRKLAVRLAERAVELDPGYADAWALIASIRVALATFGSAADNDRERAISWAAADKALELDPTLADAYAAKARLLTAEGRFDEAEKSIDIALRLDPASHLVNYAAASLAAATRNFADGVRFNEAAIAADESDVSSAAFLHQCLTALGDVAGAQAAAREVVARVERAIAAEPDAAAPLAYGVTALNALGEKERARAWVERALLFDPDDVLMRYNLACAVAQMGDADYALDLLEQSLAISDRAGLLWAETDSDLDPLREHPRFKAIMAAQAVRLEREERTPAAAT
jgi:adenylate cyclase